MAKWSNSEISVTVDEEEIKVKWMVYRNTFFRIILISEAETFLSRLADMFLCTVHGVVLLPLTSSVKLIPPRNFMIGIKVEVTFPPNEFE